MSCSLTLKIKVRLLAEMVAHQLLLHGAGTGLVRSGGSKIKRGFMTPSTLAAHIEQSYQTFHNRGRSLVLVRVTLGENPAAPRPEVGYGCQKCQLIIGEGTNELKRLAGHAMATPYTPESIVRSDEPFL